MVDVSEKAPTLRSAVAEGWVRLNGEAMAALLSGNIPKGDVICAAQLAGIQAAKRTPELLPLCHPLGEISAIEVVLHPQEEDGTVHIEARVKAEGRTGVEMEALCAVAAAALCVHDMCKGLDPAVEIAGIRLLEKSGGRQGLWRNPETAEAKKPDA
ncbi:MAG: cyclic pyranopterin monophosphate synthase MoaC [Armatimonadetes bacterium]|nr:cyclic pyranopterin monophosphate synthase MoaC [Armatimonadota bacterium]NIM24291.1 cyclic pyranopterin monophosphate synthase MoaC [Armatimonadota bacterium]NIM68160.1 cyclic pyranopterin monophosphate synthase MoaC [Armatimonadota bacterium]NIM76620.1 cyclic pyranopterin monophosphate synthase MoaC [Armatimonadota bacterium]NIN06365.1 cyclic pyranopterin monophosphate synthase MoaC [Armatimonadota bacterium]